MESFIRVETPKHLDIITDLQFSKEQKQFLISSWDSKLLLYDCNFPENTQLVSEFKPLTPILALEYLKDNVAYAGALDGNIYLVDYENNRLQREKIIPVQDSLDVGINNLQTFNNLLVSSNFEKQLFVSDPRMSVPIVSKKLSKKIHKMSATSDYLVLGMSERTVEIYDHRNWSTPFQVRESGLKLQINDLKCFPDELGFAIASVDGRVSIEYFDPSPKIQEKKYAFKSHRLFDKLTQTDVVYPVNLILFNKNTNHLYTAGLDGYLNVWNWQTKRKVKQMPQFKNEDHPESIVKIAVDSTQNVLVVATSDDNFKNSRSLEQTSLLRFDSGVYVKTIE